VEPVERRWERQHPFLRLDRAAVARRLRPLFPGARVREVAPLTGGLRNTNYRVRLDDPAVPGAGREVALRLYTADRAACQREVALAARVGATVPVPAVLYADPAAEPPFAVFDWVAGVRLDELLQTGDPRAVESAARAAGAALAPIHAVIFPGAGFLGPRLSVATPLDLSDTGWPAAMEHFLFHGRAGAHLGEDLTRRLWGLVTREAPRLRPLRGDRSLVHADYKPWNLLLRPPAGGAPPAGPGAAPTEDAPLAVPGGVWSMAAVLDWEFAFAGPPLVDVAIFLRHRAALPPAYVRGFLEGYAAAGGRLPEDWAAMTRLLDLLNLASMLERARAGSAAARDICALMGATVDGWGAL
jgi:aminoglycoside phosphotransferase (APT) family kinase protein